MKMLAVRLQQYANNIATCEHCGSAEADFGVVSMRDIFESNDSGMTRRETAEDLIWDKGIGMILCQQCLDEKRSKSEHGKESS